MNENMSLLPAGFRDVLPPQVAQEARTLALLLGVFEGWGYDQVKPPLVEFSGNTDASLARQTFRMADPESGEMLAIRTDITPQVARMAALRLKAAPRPLRLSYNGQVLRVKGEGLHAERQLAQVGAELIGEKGLSADTEVVLLAIEALHKAGIPDICVDFSLPQLQAIVLGQVSPQLAELIEKKDVAAIRQEAGEAGETLTALIAAAGDADRVFSKVKGMALPVAASQCFAELEKLVAAIRASGARCSLTIDPLERKGFEYHTGIAFSFFAKGSVEELGRGGRYSLPGAKKADVAEDAVGFSLTMNALLRAIPDPAPRDRVFVPLDENPGDLREKGMIVVQGLEPVADAKAEAKRLRCTHVLAKGAYEKL